MVGIVLQVSGADIPTWLQTVLQGSDLLSGFLGLIIAAVAYRGYVRNRSRPMLFISAGFVLALGVPVTLFLVGSIVPRGPAIALALVAQASEVTGLACILYALRV